MASKREWESQRRADKQQEYKTGFLKRLDAVNTFAEAYTLARRGAPPPDSIGRIAHSNLAFFLDCLADAQPRFPDQGSLGECAAYVALAERLHANGELRSEKTLATVQGLGLPAF